MISCIYVAKMLENDGANEDSVYKNTQLYFVVNTCFHKLPHLHKQKLYGQFRCITLNVYHAISYFCRFSR